MFCASARQRRITFAAGSAAARCREATPRAPPRRSATAARSRRASGNRIRRWIGPHARPRTRQRSRSDCLWNVECSTAPKVSIAYRENAAQPRHTAACRAEERGTKRTSAGSSVIISFTKYLALADMLRKQATKKTTCQQQLSLAFATRRKTHPTRMGRFCSISSANARLEGSRRARLAWPLSASATTDAAAVAGVPRDGSEAYHGTAAAGGGAIIAGRGEGPEGV